MIGTEIPLFRDVIIIHYVDSSSVDAVKERVQKILVPLASKFNLSVEAFGSDLSGDVPAYGSLVLSDAWGTALHPAPVTPSGADSAPYALLSATIKASVYDAGITQKVCKQRISIVDILTCVSRSSLHLAL